MYLHFCSNSVILLFYNLREIYNDYIKFNTQLQCELKCSCKRAYRSRIICNKLCKVASILNSVSFDVILLMISI